MVVSAKNPAGQERFQGREEKYSVIYKGAKSRLFRVSR